MSKFIITGRQKMFIAIFLLIFSAGAMYVSAPYSVGIEEQLIAYNIMPTLAYLVAPFILLGTLYMVSQHGTWRKIGRWLLNNR